jgi:hypothetical protein
MRELAPLFESAEQVRARVASLRWVADGMQDTTRAHDLRQFADQLEDEAIKQERPGRHSHEAI